MQKKLKICLIILYLIGIILFVLGLVLGFVVFPDEVEKQVKENVILESGTEQWDRFVKLPVPLNFKIHFFHVNNQPEFLNGAKASVVEKGPYVYTESREKKDLKYDDDREFVLYNEFQQYEFDEKMSRGKESDIIDVLNVPYIATLQMSEGLGGSLPFNFEDEVLPYMFDDPNVFTRASVKDLLFDGITFCEKSKVNLGAKLFCMVIVMMDLKNIKSTPDRRIFSFLDFKNNKDTGLWKVDTGIKYYKHLGEIVEWNNNEYTDYWKGKESVCNKIEGRDSTIYPPLFDKDEVFSIFSLDICRTARMKYKEDVTFRDIDGYRYEATEDLYKAEKPEDSCYCIKKSKDETGKPSCFLDGLLDLYTCYGAPLLASNPYFFQADERYINMVDGLTPDPEKHSSYADLEPNTGTPLRGAKRIQLNLVVRPFTVGKSIIATENIKGAVLPIIWIEEGTELNDEYIDKLNSLYFNVLTLLDAVKWTLVAIGLAVFLFSTGFTIYKCQSI